MSKWSLDPSRVSAFICYRLICRFEFAANMECDIFLKAGTYFQSYCTVSFFSFWIFFNDLNLEYPTNGIAKLGREILHFIEKSLKIGGFDYRKI